MKRRRTFERFFERIATVFHRGFEGHQSRWNAWRCSRLANLPWREVHQDMHPSPLTFSATLLLFLPLLPLSLFHRWRFRETPDIPLRLHPRLFPPSILLFPLHRPGTPSYEYRQLFFTLVEHISTTVGIERLDGCLPKSPNMPRNPRSLIRFNWDISPFPWRKRSILKDGWRKGWSGPAQGMNKDEVWTDEYRSSSLIRDLISFLWHLVERGGESSFIFFMLTVATLRKLIVKKGEGQRVFARYWIWLNYSSISILKIEFFFPN